MSAKDELDRTGVLDLGDSVVMTRAAYAQSIGYSDDFKPMSITARFSQGEWWRRQTGQWVRIAEMSAGHRYNTAAMLMRGATVHAFRYVRGFASEVDQHDGGEMAHESLERALDELNEQAIRDPQEWLRGTTLYRALTKGLTVIGSGTDPWQHTGRDPVTGEPTEVPPAMDRHLVCQLDDCGCSGKAHA